MIISTAPSRSSLRFWRPISLAFALAMLPTAFALSQSAAAQVAGAKAAAPAPDTIVFTNGDQLTGKLLREANGSVTFHSDVLGDLTISWDKIKTLRSLQQFAVIQQGQKITRKSPENAVPKGTIDFQNQQIQLNVGATGAPAAPVPAGAAAAPTQIPVKNVQYLIDEDTYTKELHGKPGFTHGWTGSVTAGASQIEATQNSRSFTTTATAVRMIPNVNWLPSRTRTLADFNLAYGSLSEPNTPTTKTNIIHGDAEQDWYFSPRFYALAIASFDHNYSQGLDLQQIYGGGFGYTVVKTPRQEFDLKTDIHFERQSFGFTPGVVPPIATPGKNLVGADVGDTYMLKLPRGMVFNQSLVATPAFNNVNAYSALLNAGLVFPAYKRFSFNLGLLDDFLNDPAVGSKKNSFQYTAGLGYTF